MGNSTLVNCMVGTTKKLRERSNSGKEKCLLMSTRRRQANVKEITNTNALEKKKHGDLQQSIKEHSEWPKIGGLEVITIGYVYVWTVFVFRG